MAENKKAVMMMGSERMSAIRAAFFLFIFFSANPCFCLSVPRSAGPSSLSSGGGAVDQTRQLTASHTSIRRQVISIGGRPGASGSRSSAAGRGTLPGARGGGRRPRGSSLDPVVYGAVVGAAARSRQDHKSSSMSNYCWGSKLLLTAWAAFSCLLLLA